MKRDERIQIRLTGEEKSVLRNAAEETNLTMSETVRQLIRKGRVIDSEPFKDLNRQIARIGNNLNQITRWVNRYKSDADTNRVLTGLVLIERQLKNLRSSVPKLKETSIDSIPNKEDQADW